MLTYRIIKTFSLLLVLETPAPKTCGVRGASNPVQFLYNQLILPVLGISSAGVCSYTQPGCVCRSLACCPWNLNSGLAWDPRDSSEWEQIHVELQHISPPLSSKAMEETSQWQRDPREVSFTSPLLWCVSSGRATPFSAPAMRALPGQVWKHRLAWARGILVLLCTPHVGTGYSTTPELPSPPPLLLTPHPQAAAEVCNLLIPDTRKAPRVPCSVVPCLCTLPRVAGCTCLSHQALLKQTVQQYLLIISLELRTTCTWELCWLEKTLRQLDVLRSGPDSVEIMHKNHCNHLGKSK